MSKGIFGSMFDFNRDGNLDLFEQATELSFLQKMMKDNEEEDESSNDYDESDIRVTLEFSTRSGNKSDGDEDWRDQYYGDEIGIDPDDYDSEDEYLEAVEEKESWINAIPDKVSALAEEYSIEPEDYDSYDEFIDALKDEL